MPDPRIAAPRSDLAVKVDQRFDWYLWKHAPNRADTSFWISATQGIRSQLRDEIVEIFQGRKVKIQELNWLIGYEARQLRRRWHEGNLYALPEDDSHVKTAALWTGISAIALGCLLMAYSLVRAQPVVGFIAFVILAASGYQGTLQWTGIVLERRRAAADQAESDRKFAERHAEYERWSAELESLRPKDRQMAKWLECDKKVILKRALTHYGLNRSDVISYAFLETPSAPYERASLRNGPWRYTRYKVILFLLTTDGIRQVTYELSFRDGDIQQREWQSYSYDAIASVQAGVDKYGVRQAFTLHLVSGHDIPLRVATSLTEWDPDDGDVEVLSRATEDAMGLRNTLRILEGVTADGKEWIARETQ